ncbi:hypothetical protein PUNSTDRAFT_138200 [Punctularia strigosozonata HHB-11173 SS5]|uniref:Uncharacterized protein n=1 Tax=Punctularia strigosozonata (strain HHB-11173) TaxID=741275 RepID=R7S5T3_PUNST|nr:uncharacterized protein PUNSTDRAFT_138200 [Punctularia strigosozonata HHB-11173 SS5]EIN05016.1 hypothetical protein PUNSTDRAFT_138200 [Punctularia strigosozonata HHB-11173 SS5]
MFFKLSSAFLVATSSLALLAAASPTDLSERQLGLGSCSSSTTAQCCTSTASSDDGIISTILGLLDILPGLSSVVPIGLGCTDPVDILTCATGDLLCCSSTADAGLLGGLSGITGVLGIDCLPLVGSLPVVGGL